jgi:hypothetical protein
MAPTYAVFGAGGPTGQEVVKAILETGQENVRAVVRDPSKYASTFSSVGAEVMFTRPCEAQPLLLSQKSQRMTCYLLVLTMYRRTVSPWLLEM